MSDLADGEPVDPYTISLEALSSERGLPLGGSLIGMVFRDWSREAVGTLRLTACEMLSTRSRGVLRLRSGSTKPWVSGLETFASAALATRLGFSLRGAIPEAELERRGVGAGSRRAVCPN